jgi:hypothetical protein
MAQTYDDGGHVNTYSLDGPGQVGTKLGIYAEEDAQNQGALGQRKYFEDGRTFRYSHFVAATTVGKLAAQDWSVSGLNSIDGKFTDSASSAKDDYATTDDTIYLTDTDSFDTDDAADVYAGGYLQITDAQGEGYNYRIQSNDLGTAAGLMKIVLHDSLQAALDSETSCGIVGNMYRNLRTATTTDILVAGVTPAAVTIAYYAWLQTWGVCNCLCDASAGTMAAGTVAVLSDGTAGAYTVLGQGTSIDSEALITSDFDFGQVTTEPILGYMIEATTNAEYGPLYLQLCW